VWHQPKTWHRFDINVKTDSHGSEHQGGEAAAICAQIKEDLQVSIQNHRGSDVVMVSLNGWEYDFLYYRGRYWHVGDCPVTGPATVSQRSIGQVSQAVLDDLRVFVEVRQEEKVIMVTVDDWKYFPLQHVGGHYQIDPRPSAFVVDVVKQMNDVQVYKFTG